jgi:hypothetical protein
MNSSRMPTSNTRKSSSVQPPCLRRVQSLPNALDREVVGIPLFWFKAPKRKIANNSKPPRRRLPQFPRLERLRTHMMSPAADIQVPDLISDTNETHQTVHSTTETSDTIDDDTWSTYSTDDENENEKSYLHGLSFLEETDESGINETIL